MLVKSFCFAVCIACLQVVVAQSYIGLRETINFPKHQYNAGTQNWQMKQDNQGRMYFANNEGVLVFDGTYWQLYPLPNKTIVRSIDFGKDKRLYAGGQDEMGFFTANKLGQLQYTSLKYLLSEQDQKFADIWNIVSFGNDIFFRTTNKLFKYSNNTITVYPPTTAWLFLGIHGQQLIAHDEKRGLLVYKNGSWETLIEKNLLFKDFYITSTTPFDSNTSLITTKKGLYILRNNQLQPFALNSPLMDVGQHFSSSAPIDADNFVVGTYTNGIYQVNKKGIVIDHVAKKEGLQNSNVRSLFTDNNKNIWLGLDNGIDFIPYNNAIKIINPAIFNDGAGYSMAKFNNHLYAALSNGIYQLPLQNNPDISYTANNFSIISYGQAWRLDAINQHLYAGKEDGFFEITNNQINPIDVSTGYWTFQTIVQNNNKQWLAAGNYQGVQLFTMEAGKWVSKTRIKQLNASSRFLTIDSNNLIWVSHPYRGVYKISLPDSSATLYTQANGLPSTLNNHVYRIKNKVLIATEKGIYSYQSATNRFEPSAYYKSIFGDKSIRYLKEDSLGNIWFVQEKSLGVVDFTNANKPKTIYLPELKGNILSGFENICPIDKNNVFVGGEKGFYHINYEKYKQNIHPLQTYIRLVKATGKTDSLLFGGYFGNVNDNWQQTKYAIPAISHNYNSLHFEFTSPIYQHQANVEYSYFLEGFDKQWSGWSDKTEKDYTNLPATNYTFKVKSRNNLNTESEIATYAFTIQTPWYQTFWAYTLYIVLIIFILYKFYKLQEKKHLKQQEEELLLAQKKHDEAQQKIAYAHQLALEKAEKAVIQLQNENLANEIEFKNAELASTAMNLVQKKEFILKIKEDLEHLNKSSGRQPLENSELKKILRTLSADDKLNEEWAQFSVHFNNVHGDFLNIVKEKYPDLKAHELKLCAYLRMNLSSKEIAQLMSISVRGVEISRYRLRKKLALPTEANLFQFLFDLQRSNIKP